LVVLVLIVNNCYVSTDAFIQEHTVIEFFKKRFIFAISFWPFIYEAVLMFLCVCLS